MSLLDRRAPLPESRPWYRSVWLGAAAVALIHVVLIGFVMTSMPRTIAIIQDPREIYFVFHPRPAKPLPLHIGPPSTARRAPSHFRYAPEVQPRAITVLPPAQDLGLSLFACSPENLANLTASERAHCSNPLTMAALRGPLPGGFALHAVQGGEWVTVADRSEPASVPCTRSQKLNDGNGGSAMFVDALCAWNVLDKALR